MEPDHYESRGLHILADTLREYHRARIRAQVVVDLLCDRGVPVEETDRRRILACGNLAVLRGWTLHATTASSAEEFAAAPRPGLRIDLYENTASASLRALGDEFEARFGAQLRAEALLELLEDLDVHTDLATRVRVGTGDASALRRWTCRVAEVHRPPELFDDTFDPVEAIERMAAVPAHRAHPLVASFVQARTRGQVKALLRVLESRGVEVDEATRERALACADEATIDRWFCLAATATSAAAVFAAP